MDKALPEDPRRKSELFQEMEDKTITTEISMNNG